MTDIGNIGTPVNTCLSAGTDIENEIILKAKRFLAINYQNQYDLPPHLTYMLCPFPEYNLEKIKPEIEQYLKNKKTMKFTLGDLELEPKKRFFSIPVRGEEIKLIHKELLILFNKYRDNRVREKDITRINSGERSEEEIELIKKYGYFRVLDKFSAHITIGNVEASDDQIPLITQNLNRMLAEVINKRLEINKIKVVFHTDSEIQSEMKELWKKDYCI